MSALLFLVGVLPGSSHALFYDPVVPKKKRVCHREMSQTDAIYYLIVKQAKILSMEQAV
jgi:hypothetical protein